MSAISRSREKWVLLFPAILVLSLITVLPFLQTVWTSFTDAEITAREQQVNWIGLENYIWALTDPDFLEALGRTMYFTVVSVGLEGVLGIAVALLLNQKFRGRWFLRVIIILPWAVPTIVNAVAWRLIYHPDYGALNSLLLQLGFIDSYTSWLGDPDRALNMVILADVWKNFPLVAYIALAAMQTIPGDLLKAAAIEGAGAWKRFHSITLPWIIGPMLVVLILRTIEAFRVFDIIYVMTRGGPSDGTKTASFYVYQEYFSYLRSGSGASYAVVVAGISAVLILAYYAGIRRDQRGA
ncbi:carbohydrate ABC transporter permease [Parasedimentitalea huanghaiensis]|uniref:ABC transporter permease subunit n=1 Tax=Parasedimentitalea huanghaiensis TaxID=2682100 RepID=A0A6L6WJM3_9RHOB|nr:sugar ABC transporter permease [Zongyanglinia huanghaiensis]MVO17874.1 ABC transporter permease subunit [Zongyanglinia huanghaiensis]